MRILLVHNSYQQRGGEDAVFEAERDLLRHAGHEVILHHVHNDAVEGMSALRLGAGTVWNRTAARALGDIVASERPDVAHFHNTLPLISPAGYRAVHGRGVAVVQTLHNYRLICPSALLFRDGAVCEACVGRTVTWPAVRYACYRGNRPASAAVTAMLSLHRAIGTYRSHIDRYVALTEFARDKHVAGGLPADRIVIKPNFLAEDPGIGAAGTTREGFLFVGRLTEEKGVPPLLAAVDKLPADQRMLVAGDGPLGSAVKDRAAGDERLEYLGPLPREAVLEHMRRAAMLVFPSTWYEGFPMTIVEAFASGLPVVASNLGGMASLIEPGRNGAHFAPGDDGDIARTLVKLASDPDELARLGQGARADFEEHYSAGQNLQILEGIYTDAIEARRR